MQAKVNQLSDAAMLTVVVCWLFVFRPLSICHKECITFLSYCTSQPYPPHADQSDHEGKLESLLLSELSRERFGVWLTMILFRYRIRFQGLNAIGYGYIVKDIVCRYIELFCSKAVCS